MKRAKTYTGLIILIALLGTSCVYSEVLLDGIINAKSIWLFLVAGIMLFYWCVTCLTGKVNLKLNRLDIAVVLFFAFILINNSVHDLQFLSKRNIENLALLTSYFFVKNVCTNNKPIRHPFIIFILSFVFFQIATAGLQWFEYWPSYNSNYKFSGFFFNPSPFVIFLAALMVYALAVFLYATNKIIKIAAIAVFVLGLPVVIITLSRAAWLGLLAGVLLLLILRFNLLKKIGSYFKSFGIRAITVITTLLIVLCAAYYLYILKPDSADGRLLVWKLAVNMIADQPFTGLGQGGFHGLVLQYQSAYFQLHPDRIPTEGRLADQIAYAFNDLLQITAEQGIAGLLLFFGIVLAAVKGFRLLFTTPADKAIIAGPLAAIAVILVSGLFSYPLTVLPIQILFYFSLALLSLNYDDIFAMPPINKLTKLGLTITCFIAGAFYINYAVNTYKAYKLGYIIKDNGYKNVPIAGLNVYSYILRQESWYLLMQVDELLKQAKYPHAITALEQAKKTSTNKRIYYTLASLYTYQQKYALAESQYKFVCYALPQLLTPQYLLAKFYYNTGQTIKWQQQARQIINFNPKIPSIEITNMKAEIQQLMNKRLSNSMPR